MRTNIKNYRDLIKIPAFEDRLRYLSLSGKVGEITFGGHRELNQILYRSPEWKRIKRDAAIRDGGFDLAHEDYPIPGVIYVHHINPITIDDVLKGHYCVYDLDNLISTSYYTHQNIHYGKPEERIQQVVYVERKKNDTCPWKQ